MGIFDLYSKRQKRQRGEFPDVFTYDLIPEKLRIQIIHIIVDAVGRDRSGSRHASNIYKFIDKTLCREYGVFDLGDRTKLSTEDLIFNHFLKEKNTERVLDVVELFFKKIDTDVRDHFYAANTIKATSPDDAIQELNQRFKEHGVGYDYQSGEIVRVDSALIHENAVKPALAVLRAPLFKGANAEFMNAHEHYRHGRNKEAIAEALKSLESVLKAICDQRNWTYNTNDTAKRLIEICFQNGLIDLYLESHFTALRSTLESGVPTIRNRTAGHGQGTAPVNVPDYLVRYVMHLVASSILFLAEAHEEKK